MTVQVLLVKGPAQDAAWVESRARVEAEWAGRLQRDRAEVASVQTAEQQLGIL